MLLKGSGGPFRHRIKIHAFILEIVKAYVYVYIHILTNHHNVLTFIQYNGMVLCKRRWISENCWKIIAS